MTEIPQKEKKVEVITANSNPRIKELNKLNKDAKLRKDRDVFVVEGIRMFRELPLQNVQEVYLSESALKEYRDEFKSMGVLDGRNTWILSDGVFAGVSQTKIPQGCMAVVKCMHYQLDSVLGRNDRETFLVLDTLQDPGNMGTIFRSAEAAGVTAVLIGKGSCDPYNPKVVRSTMGAIFRVPFVMCDDLPGTVEELRRSGVVVYGAHLDGDDLYDIGFPDRVAFLIGNEGNGLTDEVACRADRLLRIPMEGKVESLNAAISATLLSYEVMRQRKRDRQN